MMIIIMINITIKMLLIFSTKKAIIFTNISKENNINIASNVDFNHELNKMNLSFPLY